MDICGSGVDGGNTQGDFLQHVEQCLDGVKRREDRRVVFNRAHADQRAVLVVAVGTDVPGIDQIGDMTLADRGRNVVGILADLLADMGADAVLLEEFGRSFGRFDIEAEIIEAADQRQRFVLVLIRDGHEDSTVVSQIHTGSLQGFIQCPVQTGIVADRFTGRFHFR